jgi:Cu(I)/Ag(I) efflux system membrane fusion protein
VLSPSDQPVVYVARGGGAFEERSVKLGRCGDEYWEVLAGLNPGETVVTAGNLVVDAQAQLSQTAHRPEKAGATTTTNTALLNTDQEEVVSRFIALVDEVGSALAGDNLVDYNRSAQALHAALPGLLDVLESSEKWHPALRSIAEQGHLEPAANLTSARQEFLALSQATSDLARELKKQAPFASLKIFQCPMLNAAIPDAPKTGYWIQRTGPIRNPFFGSRMIDCGNEIQ